MPAPVCRLRDTPLPEKGCQSLPQPHRWWGRRTGGGPGPRDRSPCIGLLPPSRLAPSCLCSPPSPRPLSLPLCCLFQGLCLLGPFSLLVDQERRRLCGTDSSGCDRISGSPAPKSEGLSPPFPTLSHTGPASVPSFSRLGHCSSPGPHQDRVECQPDRSFWG